MDKRSLLAIVLTLGVLVAWQAFYVEPKQREAAQVRERRATELARADSIAALERPAPAETLAAATPDEDAARGAAADTARARPSESAFLSPAPGPAEVLVAVSTGVSRVTLTSRGGEVASVTLPKFPRKDGSPVELVPPEARGGLGLELQRGGDWTPLGDAGFETYVDGVPVAADAEIQLGEGRDSAVVLFRRAGARGEAIEKRFTFRRGSYETRVGVAIGRGGELAGTAGYRIGWTCGLATNEPDVRAEHMKFAAFGVVGAEHYKADARSFGKETSRSYEGTVVWGGARTRYFLSALVVDQKERGSGTLTLLGNRADNSIGWSIAYPFRGDPRLVEDSYLWYAGPLDMKLLKAYGVGLERTIDLGRLRFLSVPTLALMVWMARFIRNYGVIIIILSVLTKLLFYRLTHKSFKAMKDMQRLQPRIKEIQEKYKGDRDRLNKETMKAYKEAGVNPLGGCLPLLLQMPVFIVLYNVLGNTIELRGAPFVGWIDDLSLPDTIFRWGASIPFIGREFHLLPILMGGAMVLQSKLGGSPTGDGAPAMQTKMMNYMMPVLFTVMFYGMPSGLVLYWLVNQVLSVGQQYIVQREIESEERANAAAGGDGAISPAAPEPPRNGRGKRRAKD